MLRWITIGVFLCVALTYPATEARASSIVYKIDYAYSGTTTGTQYVVATFEDFGTDTVLLTMTASNITSGSAVDWYFNLVPTLDSSLLGISQYAGATASVTNTTNCCKADGDGFFDLEFLFSGGALAPGDFSQYLLTMSGLTAFSFVAQSTGGPDGKTGFFAAAHLHGTTGNLQAWIADIDGPGVGTDPDAPPIPEPTSMLLLGTGLLGAGARRWWQRKT